MVNDPLREIPGSAGPLEIRLDLPAGTPRAVAVLGHPHPQFGGTLQTKPVHYIARALTAVGVAVLRFNFRGVGHSAGGFDEGTGEQDDYRAALDFVATRFPGLPIWAAGVSFGAWIAARVGASDPRVDLLLLVVPPVDRYDFSVATTAGKPVFVVQGEADEIVPVKAVRKFYGELAEPRELVVIEDADHMFDGHASILGEAVEDLLGDYPTPHEGHEGHEGSHEETRE